MRGGSNYLLELSLKMERTDIMIKDKKLEERIERNLTEVIHTLVDVIGKERFENCGNGPILLGTFKTPKRAYGLCQRNTNYSVIKLNENLVKCSDEVIRQVLMHELLHTLKDTHGHGKQWQYYAKKISDNTDYKISTCGYIKECNLGFRYFLHCPSCGDIHGFFRLSSKLKKTIEAGSCTCNICRSTCSLVDAETHETILKQNYEL